LHHDNAASHTFLFHQEIFLPNTIWLSSHPPYTTSRMHLKMAEKLGTVHTRGRKLLRGWRWPVGPKLVFDQMVAPVPEIMDSSLYFKKSTISADAKKQEHA
jgi:hypothetical protein